jgi:poly(A) polymerase
LGGAADLENGILRQCAPDSLSSDPVRTIRAARQAAQFGLQIERETHHAARAAAPLLVLEDGALVQPERVRDELVKLLSLTAVGAALQLMVDLGLLQIVLPQALAANVPFVGRLVLLQCACDEEDTATSPISAWGEKVVAAYRQQLREHLGQTFANGRPLSAFIRLVALTHDVGRPQPAAEEFASRLRLSNEEQIRASRAEVAFRRIQALTPPLAPRAIHRYYCDVDGAGIDGVLLAAASFEQGPSESWLEAVALPLLRAFFRRHQQIVAPPPLVTGHELTQHLDLSPGPLIGEMLARLLEEQAEGAIRTKKQALRFAKRLLKELGD